MSISKPLDDINLLILSEKIISTDDLNSILDTINTETTSILEAERCTLYVYDPYKDELWSKIAQELEIDEIRLKPGQGIAGEVAKTKEVLNIKNAYDHPSFNSRIDERTGYHTKTILVCPLLNISQELVGVIEVLNKKEGTFTEWDEHFIKILSKISAIAIEQAQLYEWNKILRQYNENIIENMSSGLLVLDTEYTITLLNKVAETIFSPFSKISKGQVLSNDFPLYKYITQMLDDINTKGSSRIHNVEIAQNDKKYFFNIRGSKLQSDSDIDYGYIFLVDDITEKILLEQASKQKENLSLIGNMTSSIIHDIKNPLSIIKAYLQIMNKKNTDENFSKYFSVIYSEIDRLVSMTGEVLNFARGESDIKLETCKFIDFIYDVAPLIKQLFREKGIKFKIRVQYQGDILMDKDKIRRLFYNIASNANNAMRENGGVFDIWAYKEENLLKIHFKDNGQGIPHDMLEQIFIPFITSNKHMGIGLGMSIVKKIVDEHNGSILVTSKENEGTEIIVQLPLIPV